MKIVWISHGETLGGAEISLWEGVRGLCAAGHEVHVVLPARGELLLRLREVGSAVSVVSYGWWVHGGDHPISLRARLRKAVWHTNAALRIVRLLRRVRPDVVITNTLTIPSGALAAKIVRIPHVWYIHEFGKEDHNLDFDLGLKRSFSLINALSRTILVNSQAILQSVRPCLPGAHLRQIYYAVEAPTANEPVSRIEHEQRENLHLLLVGQVVPGKRQEDAIRALHLLAQRGIKANLTLLGAEHNANYSSFLRQLAQEMEVASQVEFVPFTKQPFSYMARADVLLMCSQREAFGRVTIEGMKAGTPIVGAASAGTTELIQDGVNGLRYTPGDSDDLACKLERLSRDRDLTARLGVQASRWAHEHFNLNNYTHDLLDVLHEATSPRRRQHDQ